MTKDEITEVAKIISEADGGCPTCVGELCAHLCHSFPDHRETILEVVRKECPSAFTEEFNTSLEENKK
jgi:hypothetical protein